MKHEIVINGECFFIPNTLIPCKQAIEQHSEDYEKNVFVMIKYRDENILLREYIKRTLKELGLNCVYADDTQWRIVNEVTNPLAVLYCCKYGIAVFDSPEEEQLYNPNVAYELGVMHFQGKESLIIIEDTISIKKPFDILSRLHKTYKNELQIYDIICKWVDEIGINKKQSTPTALVPFKVNKNVAVAVVKNRQGKCLITERSKPEGRFKYGFPARELKVEDLKSEDATKAALEKECQAETNIIIKVKRKIGERIHPETGVNIQYWECEYKKGVRRVKDLNEIKSIEWMTLEEVEAFFDSEIYQPVREFLAR